MFLWFAFKYQFWQILIFCFRFSICFVNQIGYRDGHDWFYGRSPCFLSVIGCSGLLNAIPRPLSGLSVVIGRFQPYYGSFRYWFCAYGWYLGMDALVFVVWAQWCCRLLTMLCILRPRPLQLSAMVTLFWRMPSVFWLEQRLLTAWSFRLECAFIFEIMAKLYKSGRIYGKRSETITANYRICLGRSSGCRGSDARWCSHCCWAGSWAIGSGIIRIAEKQNPVGWSMIGLKGGFIVFFSSLNSNDLIAAGDHVRWWIGRFETADWSVGDGFCRLRVVSWFDWWWWNRYCSNVVLMPSLWILVLMLGWDDGWHWVTIDMRADRQIVIFPAVSGWGRFRAFAGCSVIIEIMFYRCAFGLPKVWLFEEGAVISIAGVFLGASTKIVDR